MNKSPLGALVALVALCGLAALAPADAATLVRDGQPNALIPLAEKRSEFVTQAANELREHIAKISGAQLEITNLDAPEVVAFQKKTRRSDRPRKQMVFITESPAHPRGGFQIQVDDEQIQITANGEGVVYAVSELLEQLGV